MSLLENIRHELKEEFVFKKRILSFEEYFDMLLKKPYIHLRNSTQYLLDCFEYFGKKGERFFLFDLSFRDGVDSLVGQEEAQAEVYRILKNFVRQGRGKQLILFYGPNGSGKTTFIKCIAKALEHYSTLDEGAVYTFSWIFPNEKIMKKPLGFGEKSENGESLKSFAYLSEEDINVKIPDEMKDPPIYLIPLPQREKIFNEVLKEKKDFIISETILRGALSPMSKTIFDALFTSYNGDLALVLRHVQIERFFFSARYRKGVVTVEPQLQTDAGVRQITLNRSLESLPKVLQNKTLFEAFGDLVDANRGIIEYNDIFKRPAETYKYLLATCENSTASLPSSCLYFDLTFFGSTNEKYFKAFTEYPDWASFKGRLELVYIPYITNYLIEKEIYDANIYSQRIGKHIAPHTTLIASIFSVLTRLRRPNVEKYLVKLRDILGEISPIDKAILYAEGKLPQRISFELMAELKANIMQMQKEGREGEPKEGSFGASPREILESLLLSAQNPFFPCLSPLCVFEEFEKLIKQKELYEFLKMRPERQYHNYPELLDEVKKYYLNIIDEEVKEVFGFVSEKGYIQLFQRYVFNVSHHLKGEKLKNPLTGEYEEPDRIFMEEMERSFENRKNPLDFRKDIIAKIGAWKLSNPHKDPPYEEIFPELFDLLKKNYYEKHKHIIKKNCENLLKFIAGERSDLLSSEIPQIEGALNKLININGYCEFCVKEIITHLYKNKYT